MSTSTNNPTFHRVFSSQVMLPDSKKTILDFTDDWIRRMEKDLEEAKKKLEEYPEKIKALQRVKYLRQNLDRKIGYFEKHMVSSRMTPGTLELSGCENIIISWNIAMTIFQPHLENILMKNGLNAGETSELFNKYINRYDERLHTVMMKIIHDYSLTEVPE